MIYFIYFTFVSPNFIGAYSFYLINILCNIIIATYEAGWVDTWSTNLCHSQGQCIPHQLLQEKIMDWVQQAIEKTEYSIKDW